jgi:DNA-directed RNA polymerase subunit RPC12/RpoP
MSNQESASDQNPNVNVTLGSSADLSVGRTFPCPLCSKELDLRQSRSRKPYCVCDSCGMQIFFRGKEGISRLQRMLEASERVFRSPAIATPAIAAFNRLEQLRAQKRDLEQRRPLIFTDDDLEHTIAAVDLEISRLQGALEQMSAGSKS